MSNQDGNFKKVCDAIATVAGNQKRGWHDVSLVLVQCIDHFNGPANKDGTLIAKLHNAFNGEGGNKSIAKAIKTIALEYWGVKVGRGADGKDRSKNSKEQYNKHTDVERDQVYAMLSEGKLVEANRILEGNNEGTGAGQDNTFKMTKEMKASPEFASAFNLGKSLYAIKEKAGRDATLTMIERQIKALLEQADEHYASLANAKPAIGAKLAEGSANDEQQEEQVPAVVNG